MAQDKACSPARGHWQADCGLLTGKEHSQALAADSAWGLRGSVKRKTGLPHSTPAVWHTALCHVGIVSFSTFNNFTSSVPKVGKTHSTEKANDPNYHIIGSSVKTTVSFIQPQQQQKPFVFRIFAEPQWVLSEDC